VGRAAGPDEAERRFGGPWHELIKDHRWGRIQMARYAFFEGKFVPLEEAKISVQTDAFLY